MTISNHHSFPVLFLLIWSQIGLIYAPLTHLQSNELTREPSELVEHLRL